MSVREPVSLSPAIGVGVAIGLVVLAAQPAVPSARVGVVPLVASAVGTVVAIAWVMLDEQAIGGFDALLEELGGDRS